MTWPLPPSLYLAHFLLPFCRLEVRKIKGRMRWKEVKLTPTHISCAFFFSFPLKLLNLSLSLFKHLLAICIYFLPLFYPLSLTFALLSHLHCLFPVEPSSLVLLFSLFHSPLIWLYVVIADVSPGNHSKSTLAHEEHMKDKPALSERLTSLQDEIKQKRDGRRGENKD